MPEHENILTPPLMLVRYAGLASLLTTVWESRRKLQERNAELEGRVADTKILMGRHVDALYERIHGEQKRHQEELARTQIRQQKAAARVAELEAFVADIARHGLRGDMNPTMISRSAEEREAKLLQYLRSLNDHLKAAAREYVPDADVPNDRGRPRPASKIATVSECVTELDLLRAQDGDR